MFAKQPTLKWVHRFESCTLRQSTLTLEVNRVNKYINYIKSLINENYHREGSKVKVIKSDPLQAKSIGQVGRVIGSKLTNKGRMHNVEFDSGVRDWYLTHELEKQK